MGIRDQLISKNSSDFSDLPEIAKRAAKKIEAMSLEFGMSIVDIGQTGAPTPAAFAEGIASQLPGRIGGPADAYRHLLWSAELTRLGGANTIFVPLHEFFDGFGNGNESSINQDKYNNEIGRKIGEHAKDNNLSYLEMKSLVHEVMEQTFSSSSASSLRPGVWHQAEGGYLISQPNHAITLSNGLEVPSAAVLPNHMWENNPVINVTSDVEGPVTFKRRARNDEANWPTENSNWKNKFNYDGAEVALKYVEAVKLAPVNDIFSAIWENGYIADEKTIQIIIDRLKAGERPEQVKKDMLEDAKNNMPPNCFAAGTPISMLDGSVKPIEQVKIGDLVMAYTSEFNKGQGTLTPRRVTRTYATPDKLVIDFHGLKVTPGHVFLCGDGKHAGQHQMLMEILRSDGTIVHADGTVLRAATNVPVGTPEDAFVQIAYLTDANDALMQSGKMRAGTLILTAEGETKSVLQCMEEEGYRFDPESGLIAKGGEEPHPLYWFGEIPRPEDYILKRSDLTDADLYAEPDYRPEVATEQSRLGRGFTPAEGTLHATAVKRAGETVH